MRNSVLDLPQTHENSAHNLFADWRAGRVGGPVRKREGCQNPCGRRRQRQQQRQLSAQLQQQMLCAQQEQRQLSAQQQQQQQLAPCRSGRLAHGASAQPPTQPSPCVYWPNRAKPRASCGCWLMVGSTAAQQRWPPQLLAVFNARGRQQCDGAHHANLPAAGRGICIAGKAAPAAPPPSTSSPFPSSLLVFCRQPRRP